ncbi:MULTISPECIES: hypothetical protein [unclassified Bradyrhizobium]|uniref:hypothetical protein n=1 Tax=unclassified Bradyrhizobium TaxID=2631580 RepID=UPI0028E752BA|nr:MULTISPECIES: hypothetical protein [unclassified Bradyrhizobium]
MAEVTKIRFYDRKSGEKIALSHEGSLNQAPGHDAQLLAFDVQERQSLVLNERYDVIGDYKSGGEGWALQNMQYDHHQSNGPWVFYQNNRVALRERASLASTQSSSGTFSVGFDFQSAEQREVLKYLQENNYTLVGFKGAQGPQQVTVGVPTWFSVPFLSMFGDVTIDYRPLYKVYIYNSADIAVQTIIKMQALSTAIELGQSLTFNADGSFTSGGVGSVPANTIGVFNSRPANTSPVTVGLAGLVDTPSGGSQYLPFCAFTLTPQASILMTPIEQVLLFAAQTNLTSGNVQANAAAPGCRFAFTPAVQRYDLMVTPSTYQVNNRPGTPPVQEVQSGSLVALVNNLV